MQKAGDSIVRSKLRVPSKKNIVYLTKSGNTCSDENAKRIACSLQQVFKLGNRSRRSRTGLRNTWVDNVLMFWGKWNQRGSSAAGLERKGEWLTIAVKMTAVDVQNPKLWH